MPPTALSAEIKSAAAAAGFDLCGICRPRPIAHSDYLRRWLAMGRAGTMHYLHRHVESRLDIRSWLPWARSLVVVGLNYAQQPPALPPGDDRSRGKVAMYAWGEDYHAIVRDKLERAAADIEKRLGQPFQSRICVDTSAVVERELAAAAGIGWIGKNTMVISPSLGSFFLLGVLATDLDAAPDVAEPDHCGSCTRCLDACPTAAFPAPYEMDARRCISYLTIEHRGEIEPALAEKLGDWVFGCDDCQTVCPFNRSQSETTEPRFRPAQVDAALPLIEEICNADDATLRAQHRRRATSRAKPAMWRRNARAVWNSADPRGDG